jgi:membrane-bound lytic murein transglycosylase A
VSFDRLPGWRTGQQAAVLAPLRLSCAKWLERPAGVKAGGSVRGLRAGAFHRPCRALARLGPTSDHAAVRAAIERWFAPFEVAGSSGGEGLFTGYFEPEITGALQKSRSFSVPVYARPRDLARVRLGAFDPALKGKSIVGRVQRGAFVPYPVRHQIDAGALGAAARPLAWAADPVDVFFLQIQGSGRVRLPDGKILRLGFDGHNGQPYTSIGGVLVRRGALDRSTVSMQSIRAWLAANPTEIRPVLNSNARYVFFRRLTGPGPIGASNVPLTPGRSLAVDRRLIPLGIPVWLATTDALDAARPYRRLMVAQDTGGAIKGAVRGDIFFGAGPDAAARAGRMNRPGRYFLLLPRDAFPGS